MPPELFDQYVVDYLKPMIAAIHAGGGFVRVHCHGRVRAVLPRLVALGVDATDPLEPPPQGDITLAEVRQQFGESLVLFGNIEITDIENLSPPAFEKIVAQSLAEGTTGPGRGFVLMPSASPYGRIITPTTLANYQTMVRLVQAG
ncbi:MAG: uroporphyrinogen decarboxylase family protein [Phycisphaerae bacterium]